MLTSPFDIVRSHNVAIVDIHAPHLKPAEAQELVAELADSVRYDNVQYFVLDMHGVRSICSQALASLLTFARDLEHVRGRVALANCQPAVASVFKVTRLNLIFELCDDVAEARAMFG